LRGDRSRGWTPHSWQNPRSLRNPSSVFGIRRSSPPALLGGVHITTFGMCEIYTIKDYFAGRKPVLPAMEDYLEVAGEEWRDSGRQSKL